MRLASLKRDGWRLHDGTQYHRNAPLTFWIPDRSERKGLREGDFAKLIFEIMVRTPKGPSAFCERMWVIVTDRTALGYTGILDNNPFCQDEGGIIWSGQQLHFRAEHVIDVTKRADAAEAGAPYVRERPAKRWI